MAYVSKLLHATTALVAALSQSETNGRCKLGTFQAEKLPQFLENNPVINGYPWGSKDAWNSDPYHNAPETGVVRSYDFTIARGTVAPDGFERSSLLINGQFPGPTIEANWGDTIQVTVHNNISNPIEGTTIHWHGLRHGDSSWMDGVPAVTQCPISPGSTFTYRFRATPHGTTWYHSHYSGQYVGGAWGPLIIHGPKTRDYDIDLGPITLSEHYHQNYLDIVKDIVGPDLTKVRPKADNNLINGKMNFDCTGVAGVCTNKAGLSKFEFQSGKRLRLRLINTGTIGIQKFSIDNHIMKVIAVDFIPIEPYNATIVTLAVGQRTDVIVEAVHKPKDIYWMRSTLSEGQCTEPGLQRFALATIYYEKANKTAAPDDEISVAHVDTTEPCSNDNFALAVPSFKIPAGTPATTAEIEINFGLNADRRLVWKINNSTFRGDLSNPLLLLAKAGKFSYPDHPEWNVYNFGSNSSIRVILNNKTPTSHPWHLHGHDMFALAEGTGTWDGKIVNAENPHRRDVLLLPANGYLVVQWDADNPGVWAFHCHIAWHLSGGLYLNVLERPEDIQKLPIPFTAYENCRDWAKYTGANDVEQLDSGL